jgi:NitT/TauT family transport system substrate-binding protein
MKRRKTGFAWLTTVAFLFITIGTDRARAETAELRIAYQHSMAFLVVDVMLGKKLIEARAAAAGLNALKVSTVRFASGPAANDALLKGDVEVGGAGVAPFLDLWAKSRGGANVRGIAPINNSPLYLISTDARIQTAKDLGSADKTAVPAPGSIQGLFLRMLADRAHGNPAHLDAAMASMTSADAIKALASPESGMRNYVGSIPFNLTAMALPGAREVANSYDYLGGPHTLVLLFVTEKFKMENPKTFAVLAAAIEDAMSFIKSNPQETAAIFAAASNGATSPARVLDVLGRRDVSYDMTPRGTEAFATFMQKIGALKVSPATWKDAYWENLHTRDGS